MRKINNMKTINLHGKEHPTYGGVLAEAHERGLLSITTELLQIPNEENNYLAIVQATVIMKDESVFQGLGDASPKNVNSMIAPHIVRMAETRAKGRALRDAINVAEALAEELMSDNGGGDDEITPENDVMEKYRSEHSECEKCGAKMVKSNKGNWYCSDKCWL